MKRRQNDGFAAFLEGFRLMDCRNLQEYLREMVKRGKSCKFFGGEMQGAEVKHPGWSGCGGQTPRVVRVRVEISRAC